MSSISPLNRRVPKIEFTFIFVIMFSLSPLNDKISSMVASQSVVSSLSPLTRQTAKSPFCLLLCLVHHLWIVNTPSLVISNRLYPVCHLWTDEYPILSFFIIMSSSSPMNDKTSCPVIPNHHVLIITSEWQNFELGNFSIGYVQLITSELTDSQVSLLLTVMFKHLWIVTLWVW